MKRLQFCLVSLSLLMLVLGAAAQVQNGQFAGTVTDPSGAAIAGARVTVTNPATNLSVTTTTNETGLYTLKELPIGIYRITAEAKGFKTTSNTSVTLNAGTIARVDFKMELGQTREVIEVTRRSGGGEYRRLQAVLDGQFDPDQQPAPERPQRV